MSPQDPGQIPDADALYLDAACGLLLTREDGSICRANTTVCRWIGYSADELVGRRKLQDLLTIGARIFSQTHWSPLLRMQGSVAEIKVELVHRDGRTVPVLMNALRHEHPSGVFHSLALMVVEDRHKYERELLLARRRADELLVNERAAHMAYVQAEGRLRLALSSARLFVWEMDVATGERRYEDQVALLLGHAEMRRVSHAEYADAIDADDREREAQVFQVQFLDDAAVDRQCTYRLHGVDGVVRVIRSTARAVRGTADVPPFFIGVLQDVSEDLQLREAAEDRALFAEQMIGIVSHDLRNPLASIKMAAALLGRSRLDEKQVAVLRRITNATTQARRLVSDLLDFTAARLGSGISVRPRPIDLRAVLAAAVADLAPMFDGRELAYSHEGPADCVADADRLVQVVGNLVANAMAYGAGESPVRVTSQIDGARVSIAVHNHGRAIAPALQQRIFDSMARGDNDAVETPDESPNPRSVGLGLYIVRQIARTHGGDVSVTSTDHGGTTFTVAIPCGEAGGGGVRRCGGPPSG